MKKFLVSMALGAMICTSFVGCKQSTAEQEHPSKEHPGVEHPEKEKEKEAPMPDHPAH